MKKNLEQNNLFIECWTQLKVNGTLEPKLALFILNNFTECDIDYKDIDLKIDLQKRKSADQMNKMTKNVYMLLRPYLSSKKIDYYDIYFEGK
jgi:hypothetical protein